ncbi:MAG: SPOR domain-containing protein [Magnetococcales bacterium]|nr:SPOR domain-containing protein [Magnetococcales bacterium]
MKTSPNREQFLFLGAGGIILGLILVVVVFNMWGSNTGKQMEEEANVRPVVSLPPQKGSTVESNAPAQVFANQGLPPLPEDVPAKVVPEPGQAHAVVPPSSEKKGESKPEPMKSLIKTPVKTDTPTAPVAKASAKPEPVSKPEPAKAPAPAKPEPVKQTASVAKTPPAEASKPAPATASKNSAPEGRFAVNMGAYKDEARANANKTKLSGLGLPVYLQPTTDKTGATLFRVRLGPFATRTDAETASRMAKDKAGITGTVIASGQ